MRFLVTLVMFLVVSVSSFSLAMPQEGGKPGASLKGLPEMRLQDFGGKPVNARSLKASVYVFDFWATWCGPCLKEIPVWNRLQEKYGDKGLKVVGVTMASGDASEVQPFVEKRDMKYTVLMGDDDQSYDLNILGFPTTLVVTGDLKVFSTYVGSGAGKAAQIEADIQKILSQTK